MEQKREDRSVCNLETESTSVWLVRFSSSAKCVKTREAALRNAFRSAMQHDDICLGRGVDPRTPFRVRCALARVPTASARNESRCTGTPAQNAGSTHDTCAQCVELQTDRTGISYLRILLANYLCRGPL